MKTHQNILDGELKKMQTRLTRIKGMIANQRRLNGASVGKDFEKELDEIIDTNQRLELENKRLRKQVSGLKAKMATLQ
jgi:regulator of replication initiation timing